MRLLLDTCTFLWMVSEPRRLPADVRTLVVDPENDVFLSAVSAWEISLKHQAGRLHLPDVPDRFVPEVRSRHFVESLALDEAATLHLPKLPVLHGDPFDRMLICQALVHGMTIVTPDRMISQYPVVTRW